MERRRPSAADPSPQPTGGPLAPDFAMPSRVGVAVIVLFWLAVTGYVGYRDVWPRYFADAPPAIRIDLSDEATQTVPARWTVYRGDTKVGSLKTQMSHVQRDDTFRFTSTYRDLVFDQSFGPQTIRIKVPEAESVLTIGRTSELRGQSMIGKFTGQLLVGPLPVAEISAEAQVGSAVEAGRLVGRVELRSPLGDFDQPLDPVPVPGGQVLNPLQPVNRLSDIRPGRRWVIHEVNPLGEAMMSLANGLAKQHGGSKLLGSFVGGAKEPLLAQVSDRPVKLVRDGKEVECWLIEYRSDQTVTAKTWVAVADGKVLRQEATGQGETLRLEREE